MPQAYLVATMAFAAAAFAICALGGEPQCPPSHLECYSTVGDAFYSGYTGAAWGDAERDAVCDIDSWREKEKCNTDCPLQLRITSPVELQAVTCVSDNTFTPYQPNAHIDLGHPLNGKVVELVAAGDNSDSPHRTGCAAASYEGKNFTSKMALISRGDCYFRNKFFHAAAAGAALGVMVNHRTDNSLDSQTLNMVGDSGGFPNTPAVFAPNHLGDVLFEALDAGTVVKGMLLLKCDQEVTPRSEYVTDHCPDSRFIATDLCAHKAVEEDRICVTCPLEAGYTLGNTLGSMCLWGNSLKPRSEKNFLQYSAARSLPHTLGNAVLASNLPTGGCDQSDYTGLSGAALVIPFPTQCLPFEAARRASSAGVAALILMSSPNGRSTVFLDGMSSFVGIPIHSITPTDSADLLRHAESGAVFRTNPSAAPIGYQMGSLLLTKGIPPPVRNLSTSTPTPGAATPIPPVADVSGPSIQATPVVVVGFVLLAALGLAGVLLFLYLRRTAVSLTGLVESEGGLRVPLMTASMALSLSVLFSIAAVAFVLVHTAGRAATDEARSNGRFASQATYENATQNIQEAAQQLRQSMISRMKLGLENLLDSAELAVQNAADLYLDADGTWDVFDAHFDSLVEQSRATGFALSVLTPEGFFAYRGSSEGFKNDDRSDAKRLDGLPHISVTNDASLYGFATYDYSTARLISELWALSSRSQFDPSTQLSGEPGDPFRFTRGAGLQSKTWYITKQEYYQKLRNSQKPISVFTPVYNRMGGFVGSAECRVSYATVRLQVTRIAGSDGSEATAAVFDTESGLILGTNVLPPDIFKRQVQEVSLEALRDAFQLHDSPNIELRALYTFLRKNPLGSGGLRDTDGMPYTTGAFDQAEYFVHQSQYVARLGASFDGLGVADHSGNAYAAEMRGGSPQHIRIDPDLQQGVLRFDGSAVLHVYQNMTEDVPVVRDTRASRAGEPWRSTEAMYNLSMQIPDRSGFPTGKRCIGYDSRVRQDQSVCMLREVFYLTSFSMAFRIRSDVHIPANASNPPSLFSTTRVGEAVMRFFANGKLSLGILTYSCRADPLPGGLPAGEWHTITAVIDYETLTCSVYADGEFVSSGTIRGNFVGRSAATLESSPLYVGQQFRGVMAEVAFVNISMSPEEVRQAHATGEARRVVPSRMWFADVSKIQRDTAGGVEGIDWGIAVLIPRESIMGRVDANNEAVQLNLVMQERVTSRELDQIVNESVIILCAILLGSALLFMLFNMLLTRPFASIACAMNSAAVFNIEEIPAKTSLIAEVDLMFAATRQMLENLESYRPYLPDALFQNIQWNGQNGSGGKENVTEVTAPGLRSGFVAVVFTDIENGAELCDKHGDAMKEAIRTHHAVMRECIQLHQGYEVKVIGVSYMVAFESPRSAVGFGLAVQEALFASDWPKAILTDNLCPADKQQKWKGLRVTMGINFGQADVEFNDVSGRHDYHGTTINKAARLLTNGVSGAVTISQEVLDELVHTHEQPPEQRPGKRSSKTYEPCQNYLGLAVPATLLPMGSLALKGIIEKCFISVLLPESLVDRTPAVKVQMEERRKAASTLDESARGTPVHPMHAVHAGRVSSHGSTVTRSSVGGVGMDRVVRSRRPAGKFQKKGFVAIGKTGITLDVSLDNLDAMQLANDAIFKVICSVERSEGSVISVLACTVFVGWNTAKACQKPLDAAQRFLRVIHTSARERVELQNAYNIGIASGQAHFGHVGSTLQKFVTVLSPAVNLAGKLQSTAADLRVFCLHSALPEVLEGRSMRGEPRMRALCRQVDAWSLLNHPSESLAIYQVRTELDLYRWDCGEGEAQSPEEAWCWSDEYEGAFQMGDYVRIRETAPNDHLLQKVARNLENGDRFREAFRL